MATNDEGVIDVNEQNVQNVVDDENVVDDKNDVDDEIDKTLRHGLSEKTLRHGLDEKILRRDLNQKTLRQDLNEMTLRQDLSEIGVVLWKETIMALYGNSGGLGSAIAANRRNTVWGRICGIHADLLKCNIDINGLMTHSSDEGDARFGHWIWSPDNKNGFSVNSIRKLIDVEIMKDSDVPTIWCKLVPIKTNIFIWRARQDRLPTRQNLERRGVTIQTTNCPWCHTSEETNQHVFTCCRTANETLAITASWCSALDLPPVISGLDDLLMQQRYPKHSKNSDVWEVIARTLLWCLWNYRNGMVFEGEMKTNMQLLMEIKTLLASSLFNKVSQFKKKKKVMAGKTRKRKIDASSKKRPWSDINHDVLYPIMMQLGVIDFVAFSGVCKSWRSLALSNAQTFMASKPPMGMSASNNTCYLGDFQGRQFKTIIPQLVGRKLVGISCGYLIMFGEETRDFWLVNLITRHEIHFPNVPLDVGHLPYKSYIRAILVFSPSIHGWVLAMLNTFNYHIWFSIAGNGTWNHVSSTFHLLDLHAFKGKIYILTNDYMCTGKHVFEMRLGAVPKLTLVNMRHLMLHMSLGFMSSDENLYLIAYYPNNRPKLHKLDFDQLTWVPCETTMEEYVLFYSWIQRGAAIKPDSWAAPSSQYRRFFGTQKLGKGGCLQSDFWYFPHECLNLTLIDE
ncbi:hypothetical protein LXL04_027464 [Taraxacum kok-saghyz]